ncbi:uncharacterized protein LOC114647197 [Erpetoichthys calabaricus]|uniref:uncharacterized protein LOC114647197 n=1 Tax=Erpetoichthys calabaricus TaxID=27687 RepID=UPI00109FE86B|nr:uncharacterized protein LOC114647197 [Erpetoichthys calabaricus]
MTGTKYLETCPKCPTRTRYLARHLTSHHGLTGVQKKRILVECRRQSNSSPVKDCNSKDTERAEKRLCHEGSIAKEMDKNVDVMHQAVICRQNPSVLMSRCDPPNEFGSIETKLAKITEKLEGIDQRLFSLEARMTKLEEQKMEAAEEQVLPNSCSKQESPTDPCCQIIEDDLCRRSPEATFQVAEDMAQFGLHLLENGTLVSDKDSSKMNGEDILPINEHIKHDLDSPAVSVDLMGQSLVSTKEEDAAVKAESSTGDFSSTVPENILTVGCAVKNIFPMCKVSLPRLEINQQQCWSTHSETGEVV